MKLKKLINDQNDSCLYLMLADKHISYADQASVYLSKHYLFKLFLYLKLRKKFVNKNHILVNKKMVLYLKKKDDLLF